MDDVPPSLWPDNWKTLEHGIRAGRYTDADFARLERDKLWSKVWQPSVRLDEIPNVGDYATYEIVDQSVMVVRTGEAPDAVKAYYNFCPHRGTALSSGSGTFAYDKIICPFHGWRWDLEGNNEFVLEMHEFRDGKLTHGDVHLREVKHAVFAGFVFINLDPNCGSFDDYIAPVRALIEGLAIDKMRHYWWKELPVASNWKVAQEAFFEGYHVPATHPQLEPHSADYIYKPQAPDAKPSFAHWNVDYEVFDGGHGRFFGKGAMKGDVRPGVPVDAMVDAMADRLNLLATGMDAQILPEDVLIARSLKGKPIPEGSNLGGEYFKAQYATAAAKQRPMPEPLPQNLAQWGGEIFVFPNLMILPVFGNAMIYRVKPHPTDPDRCTFEIFSTKTYPAAEPVPRAELIKVTDLADPTQVFEIPRQDLGNIPRIQIGLHSKGCRQIWLASHNEKIILNMHQELDRYLQAD